MDLITLDIANEPRKRSPGFWKKQFSQEPTRKQRKFDWVYGVVIPTLCIAIDPIVFRSSIGLPPSPGFAKYRAFAYVLSFASILVMTAWLLWGRKLGGFTAPIAGLFVVGGIVSLIVGTFLLPVSLIASVVGIGLLGLTPLISGTVFLRNGVRAFRTSIPFIGGRTALYAASVAALYCLVIPFVIHTEVTKRVDRIVVSDIETMKQRRQR